MSLLPRSWHKWYAAFAGYFWLPCPLCGDYFGGHEWHGYEYDAIYKGNGIWKGICRKCASTNQERWEREQKIFWDDSDLNLRDLDFSRCSEPREGSLTPS